MYILDTNVVSELRKARSNKANPGLTEWAASAPAGQLFISVVTIHELEYGVLMRERSDARQGGMLREWLDHSVAEAFGDRVLAIDEKVARRAAGLHVTNPAPFRDALIAATGLVYRMAVVTRNVGDFKHVPELGILNPWSLGD
jgi:predicted nucleic acid-binding protein